MSMWIVRRGIPPYTREGWEVTNYEHSYWFLTEEWARFFKDHCNRLDEVANLKPAYTAIKLDETHSITLSVPEYSEWICHLFGSNGDGISWTPRKGCVPNWFWRKMQHLFFGNKWVKK